MDLKQLRSFKVNYIEEALKTTNKDYQSIKLRLQGDETIKILHGLMGMCTEIGEAMDALKKYLIYGKPMDYVNLEEEIGDLFWYCAILADACGFTFESSMEKNIAKLKARYPNKFTEFDALNRNLEKERKILGG